MLPIKKQKSPQTNDEFIEVFLRHCEMQNKSEKTILNYRCDLEKFAHWYQLTFGNSFSKADHTVIDQYQQFLKKGGHLTPVFQKSFQKKLTEKLLFWRKAPPSLPPASPALDQIPLAVGSQRRHLSTIKNFFEYLKQTHEDQGKMFLINPVKQKLHGIRLKEIDVEHTKLLTPEDWKKILRADLTLKEKLIVHILYWGGLRIHELTQLEKDDFNKRNHSLELKRKGGYLHQLKIQESKTIFDLKERFEVTLKTNIPYLFPNKRGQPLSTRQMHNDIKNIFSKAQLSDELTPHSFRKACATNLYRETKDLLLVRDYLNHKDATVTQTYIEL